MVIRTANTSRIFLCILLAALFLCIVPASAAAQEFVLLDKFPKSINGENGIFLQYRENDFYGDLSYLKSQNFGIPNVPFNIPFVKVNAWGNDNYAIGVEPECLAKNNQNRDSVIRITIPGDGGTIRLTGFTGLNTDEATRNWGQGSVRFYIYVGESQYTTPIWQGMDKSSFDLTIPYTKGDQVFLAAGVGEKDIPYHGFWKNVKITGDISTAPTTLPTPARTVAGAPAPGGSPSTAPASEGISPLVLYGGIVLILILAAILFFRSRSRPAPSADETPDESPRAETATGRAPPAAPGQQQPSPPPVPAQTVIIQGDVHIGPENHTNVHDAVLMNTTLGTGTGRAKQRCPHCGENLDPGAKWCSGCGEKL